MIKSGKEIMEMFEAFDLTGTAWSAAQLTGCDAKTVTRYVAVRGCWRGEFDLPEAGCLLTQPGGRAGPQAGARGAVAAPCGCGPARDLGAPGA